MVAVSKTFLQMVEGGRGARLLAVVAVLLSTAIAAEHGHHDDEHPVHAGEECILCSAKANGDGDPDYLPTPESRLEAQGIVLTVQPKQPSVFVRPLIVAQLVRAPPIHS